MNAASFQMDEEDDEFGEVFAVAPSAATRVFPLHRNTYVIDRDSRESDQ